MNRYSDPYEGMRRVPGVPNLWRGSRAVGQLPRFAGRVHHAWVKSDVRWCAGLGSSRFKAHRRMDRTQVRRPLPSAGATTVRSGAMAIGPVQLVVLGFNHPEFHGEIIDELERLREADAVRVIDALAVYKDPAGNVEVEHLSNLTEDEAIELGSRVGALVGLGIEGEEGSTAGAQAGAEAAAAGATPLSAEEAWDVVGEIPNDSAAALLLLE